MLLKRTALVVIVGFIAGPLQGRQADGLVLSGVDTLHVPEERGFDFVTQAKCTTANYEPADDCYNHVRVTPVPAPWRYHLTVPTFGWGLRMGKTNLDSIDAAPSDSVFENDGFQTHFDSIPPDSLQHAVGNSYIIKSGADPRCNCIYFAKFRILDVIVIDSANHEVDMVFLWACNVNSRRDLPTSDLDTFDLDPTNTAGVFPVAAATPKPRAPVARGVATVRSGVRVVRERGVGERVEVFDLRGRAVSAAHPHRGRLRETRM